MQSLVMIVHDFPPEGSAGVYRALRFVRHLPALHWRPSVVACAKHVYERYDPGLLALVPAQTSVRRVVSRDPWQAFQALRARRIESRLGRYPASVREQIESGFDTPARRRLRQIVRKAESWCYHPDPAMAWIRPATREVVGLCAAERVNVIYGSAGPVSAFAVALRASRVTGIPYVLDFRDPWTITYNEFEALRPRWARDRDRHTLAEMLRGARAVVFRYHAEAECYWRLYRGALDASRIHIIPNGYEGEIDDAPPPNGDKCNVLYVGTLSSYRYDTLLEALQILEQADPDRANRLSVAFVGEGAQALRREAEARGIASLVEARGAVTHAETVALQRKAHALLVLGRPATMKGHELFAGAKLFQYLKAGRPIIGLLPQDETRSVLRRVGVSTIADIESVQQIVALLQMLVDRWRSADTVPLTPNRAACRVYSAEYQTASLARALAGDPAMDPFVPGAVPVPPSLRSELGASIRVPDGKPGDAASLSGAH